jgi:hypothetical protein
MLVPLTADDADFADITLIFSKLDINQKKSALNQQNQRHQRLIVLRRVSNFSKKKFGNVLNFAIVLFL